MNPELYEAAAVDGAGLWRKIWHITLPQLRGVLLVTMILQIIGTAQVFLEPYLFTSGGPANATLTVLLLIYDYAFGNSLGGDYGEATALSLMLAGFLALFSLVYLRADPLVEHSMTPRRAPSTREPESRPILVRPPTGAGPSVRWGVGSAQTALLVALVVIGLGPILWLAKSAITPTQRHDLAPDGALPARRRVEQPRARRGRRRRRPLLLEHDRARARLVVRPDRRRDHRRLRALGAAAAVREGHLRRCS